MPDKTPETFEEVARAAYNESRRMGMLRVGSPIDYLVETVTAAHEADKAQAVAQARREELKRKYTMHVPQFASQEYINGFQDALDQLDAAIKQRLADPQVMPEQEDSHAN